jgi:hypothetical protein
MGTKSGCNLGGGEGQAMIHLETEKQGRTTLALPFLSWEPYIEEVH